MTNATTPKGYAIVTGAARGLGREFCLSLARRQVHVALVDVDPAGAADTLKLVEQAGGSGQVERADVTSIDAWTALSAKLKGEWPRLDLLINNAGMYASGYVGALDLAEAERLLRLNLHSVFYGCHTCVPWLRENTSCERRSVINVASSFAFLCPPGMAAYNLSKAAVVTLSETLHSELKPHGIGVTVVCPGPMPTRFVESASFDSEEFKKLTQSYVRQSKLNPAMVAAAALDAADRRQLYVILGADQRWYWRFKRLMPVTLLNRVARRVRKDLANLPRTTDH